MAFSGAKDRRIDNLDEDATDDEYKAFCAKYKLGKALGTYSSVNLFFGN